MTAILAGLNLIHSYEGFLRGEGQNLYSAGQRAVFWGIVSGLEKEGSVTLNFEDSVTSEVKSITLIEKPAETTP